MDRETPHTPAASNGFVEYPTASAAFATMQHAMRPRAEPKKGAATLRITHSPINWEVVNKTYSSRAKTARAVDRRDQEELATLIQISAAVSEARKPLRARGLLPELTGRTPDGLGTWENVAAFCRRFGFTLWSIESISHNDIARKVNLRLVKNRSKQESHGVNPTVRPVIETPRPSCPETDSWDWDL